MKKLITAFFLMLGLSSFATNPPPAIIYVKANASGTNDGTSWTNAYTKLQDALVAATGGQIWVSAGTYYPDEGVSFTDNDRSASFMLKTDVALYGGFAGHETEAGQRNWKANVTILSGDIDQNDGSSDRFPNSYNAIHVVRSNGVSSTAVLDGFTIKGGNADFQSVPDNGGGAIIAFNSSFTLANCSFSGNEAYSYGGAIYLLSGTSPATLTNCSFSGNTASYGGAIYNSSLLTVTNCSFRGNSAGQGGAIYNIGSTLSTLINCSFFGNSNAIGGTVHNYVSSTTLTNCVAWGNAGQEVFKESGTVTVSYSIVEGGYDGDGNLDKDPLFVNAAGGNLHLQACSPAIDAGNDAANTTSVDLDSNKRKVDAISGSNQIDMGAYEFQNNSAPNIVYVNAAVSGGSNDGTSWANAYTKLQDALSKVGGCTINTQIWVAAGIYYPDEGGGKINNDRNASFEMKNQLAIYGGFKGDESLLTERDWESNETILGGDIDQNDGADFANNDNNSYNVLRNVNVDSTALLDGFVVRGGNMNEALDIGGFGGGMYNYNSSPDVINCTFVGNAAYNGGGISNEKSSPGLINCNFANNKAYINGGAVYNISSSPTVTNCNFLKNTASSWGGGMYNYDKSSPLLTNCSFSKNAAVNWGGGAIANIRATPAAIINCSFSGNLRAAIYHAGGSFNIINCIMWGDKWGDAYQEISFDKGALYPVVTNSIMRGGYEVGTNIIDKDPLFVDAANGNLRLQACSPAVDSGHNTAVATTTDLDGNTRIIHNTVDLGAYEYNGPLYTFYPDADDDGYGSPSGTTIVSFCSNSLSNYAANNTDCNDGDTAINPATKWYRDIDNDNYYAGSAVVQCSSPGTGYKRTGLTGGGDCNDNNAGINPGTVEVCGNGIDDNCDGKVDETGCATCTNATNLSTTNITSNSATFNWEATANPVQWKIEYKQLATGSKWTSIILAGYLRSTVISSLKANQKYQWHIRAKCENSWTSFSDAAEFKTISGTSNIMAKSSNEQAISLTEVEEQSSATKLYPNPGKGQFMIELRLSQDINTNAKIQLVNMMGQTVSAESANISNGILQKKISISSSLAAGIYMVKILVDNKTYLARLIYEK